MRLPPKQPLRQALQHQLMAPVRDLFLLDIAILSDQTTYLLAPINSEGLVWSYTQPVRKTALARMEREHRSVLFALRNLLLAMSWEG